MERAVEEGYVCGFDGAALEAVTGPLAPLEKLRGGALRRHSEYAGGCLAAVAAVARHAERRLPPNVGGGEHICQGFNGQ